MKKKPFPGKRKLYFLLNDCDTGRGRIDEKWRGKKDKKEKASIKDAFSICLVGRVGLEPTTNGLKVRCSTN